MPRYEVWCDRHQARDTADMPSSLAREVCPICGCEKSDCNFRIDPVAEEEKENQCRTGFCPSHDSC